MVSETVSLIFDVTLHVLNTRHPKWTVTELLLDWVKIQMQCLLGQSRIITKHQARVKTKTWPCLEQKGGGVDYTAHTKTCQHYPLTFSYKLPSKLNRYIKSPTNKMGKSLFLKWLNSATLFVRMDAQMQDIHTVSSLSLSPYLRKKSLHHWI